MLTSSRGTSQRLFLAFLLCLTAASCAEGPVEPNDRSAHASTVRSSLFDPGRVTVEPVRPSTVIVEHRFHGDSLEAEPFTVQGGEGGTFECLETEGADPVPTYGHLADLGASVIVAPIGAFGGAEVFERSTAVGTELYCPGDSALTVKAVIFDAKMQRLLTSKPAWVDRGRALTRHQMALPGGRDLSLAAFVGIEFKGPPGVRALTGMWLADPVPGSEYPHPSAPEFVHVKADDRVAAALLEGLPWTAPIEARADTYLRVSLHAPSLHRGPAGEMPRVRFEVDDGDVERIETITLPESSDKAWHEVNFALGSDDPGEVRLRIHVEDDAPGNNAVVFLGEATIHDPREATRTVVLITSDTHRADYLGMYRPGSGVETPVLDALASRGMYFEDCQTTSNITTPSHVAIMTGLHPRETEIVNNSTRLKRQAATLAEKFQAAGYRTMAAVSAGHLMDMHSGLGQGFDRFYNPIVPDQRASVATNKLVEWLDDADGENVFAWLHLFDAHAPYVIPESGTLVSETRPPIKITSELLSGRGVPGWLRSVEVTGIDEVRGWYGGEVESLDRALATLLERPRVQQGWVALTSDHGENLGENGHTFEHLALFQPVLQVPMVLAGPGVPVGRSAAQIQQYSIGKTLLDLTGIEAPFPGRNMVEMATGELLDEPRFGLSSYGDQACITVGKWLLTLGLRTDSRHSGRPSYVAGRVHLFDRTLGIESEQNFVDQEPEVVRKLHRTLTAWLTSAVETEPLGEAGGITPRAKRRLKALGYSGGSRDGDARWWDPERVTDPKWRAYW